MFFRSVVWPSGWPDVSANLMLEFLANYGTEHNQTLYENISTIEFYVLIHLLVTFEPYLGHRVNIFLKWAVSVSEEPCMSAR